MTNETLQKLIFKTASFSAKVISTLLVLNSLSIMYNSLITKTGEEFSKLSNIGKVLFVANPILEVIIYLMIAVILIAFSYILDRENHNSKKVQI
jgi:hypothetical protein